MLRTLAALLTMRVDLPKLAGGRRLLRMAPNQPDSLDSRADREDRRRAEVASDALHAPHEHSRVCDAV